MKFKLVALMFVSSLMAFAQQDSKEELKKKEKQAKFDPAYTSYSNKKIAYLTIKGQEEIEGKVKGLGRKKGQIREVKFEMPDGSVKKIPAAEIASLYVSPSGLDKFSKMGGVFNDISKWGDSSLKDVVNKGYTFYTNEMVSLKNKKDPKEYLMQLVNPRFSNVFKVYSDPFAKKTSSVGFGGVKLAGGIAKSYYVKKGDKMIWLHKSDFKDFMAELFFDNEEFVAKYPERKMKWSLLGVYILDYTEFSLK